MIALLLLACSDLPADEVEPVIIDEVVTEVETGVVVELEQLPAETEELTEEPAELEADTDAAVIWYDSLPPEEQILVALVDEAVDHTVDRLVEQNKIRPTSVPVVGFVRDAIKLILGLGIALLLARARRASVDTEAIAEQAAERILGRADVVARESEVKRLAELDRLRQEHARALAEVERLRRRPAASAALPGLEDPEARRRAVEEAGRAALRRR